MAKSNIKSKSGFTIIEVVLVLAIAGLIFLMVFVALPSLQRSQRDTQRRNDYAMLAASMTDYLTNNNGNLPKEGTTLKNTMLNSTGKEPDGGTYSIKVVKVDSPANYISSNSNVATKTMALVFPKAKCSTTAASEGGYSGFTYPVSSTKARAYAIMGWLESGFYCQDND